MTLATYNITEYNTEPNYPSFLLLTQRLSFLECLGCGRDSRCLTKAIWIDYMFTKIERQELLQRKL